MKPTGSLGGPEWRRFLVFLAVGVLNTLVGYAIFVVLSLFGTGATAAVVGATLLGMLFNFRSIGDLVFRSGDPRRLPRFVMVYAVQCIVNLVLLRLAARIGVPRMMAEALILPCLAGLSFVLMRRFVFNPAPDEAAR